MKSSDDHYLVPEHENGIKKDLEISIIADSPEDAADDFVLAKEKLLDINGWGKYTATFQLNFILTDHDGKHAHRHARKGDYIKVQSQADNTIIDWLHIEAIEYDDYPDVDVETIAMRLHPGMNPLDKSDNKTATHIYVIERHDKTLHITYHSRNNAATDAAKEDQAARIADAIINGIVSIDAE
ncbi:MAG TPA: hypothetical protein VHA52_13190 [Candidatus Babeliaceae bacterium]|nr:hypothetical protein [Candidatus Babeliaceae bacterium]